MDRDDLLYMSGLFDGEGSIYIANKISPNAQRKGNGFILRVCLSNTNEGIMGWLQLTFGGTVYKHPNKYSTQRKQVWEWRLGARKAADFLVKISPYLKIKVPQAKLALEFQDRRHWGKQPTISSDILDETDYFSMFKLNKGVLQ